jgi:putative spermidine/putrescine transport system substrate-binding protein
MRKSAIQLVGKNPVINVEMKDFLPTSPDNFKKALKFDEAWWDTHGEELIKRFQDWRGSGDGKPHEPKPEEANAKLPTSTAAP